MKRFFIILIAVLMAGCVTTPCKVDCPSQDLIIYTDQNNFAFIPKGSLNDDNTDNFWTIPEWNEQVERYGQPLGEKL